MPRWLEPVGIALLAVGLLAVPIATGGLVGLNAGEVATGSLAGADAGELLGATCLLASGLSLMWWRTRPRQVAIAGPALLLLAAASGLSLPITVLAYLMAFAALAADTFEGTAAWPAGLTSVAYVALFYVLTGDDSIGPLMTIVPGYLAGTVLRLRRQTARTLAERGAELEREQGLLTAVSVRHERARIASELHDIVGHALSVMVIQAAAGQRLAARDPDATRASIAAIADSARQGQADLHRLIDLLGGAEPVDGDLAVVDELVARAARTGLNVTCRWEGRLDAVSAGTAHAAFRVVQEGMTNALRHAPGSHVRVLLRGDEQRRLVVQVQNDAPSRIPQSLGGPGSGRGLAGLRERVLAHGGTFTAGPLPGGGWGLEAMLTQDRTAARYSLP